MIDITEYAKSEGKMAKSNEELLYEANRMIGVLCDIVRHSTCSCEICPLYQEDESLCDKQKWEEEYRAESEVDNEKNE